LKAFITLLSVCLFSFSIALAFPRADLAESNEQKDHTMNQQSTSQQTTSEVPVETAVVSALVPSGFTEVSSRRVAVDAVEATLIRYERTDGRNRGITGEHVSFVLDQGNNLKGFMRMDLDLVGALPSRERANLVALDFLHKYAPDLVPNMEVLWIEPHEEIIRDNTSGKHELKTLTGTKVKCHNSSNGTYFWVIVGPTEQVITFERDIVWVTFPGHRQTEKWLHDNWLAETGR
jgi:hypothetical protein